MVDYCNPLYSQRVAEWQRARDFMNGEKAVRAAGVRYLPKLNKQKTAQYDAYKARATFFNATARTHEGLTGVIFRKDPVVTLPKGSKEMELLNQDADLGGRTLYDYSRHVLDEVVAIGRGGTLVDFSDDESRPYFAFYRAEDILNWRTERINGRVLLTMIVLREMKMVQAMNTYDVGMEVLGGADSAFTDKMQVQYRVLHLRLDEKTKERYYEQQIWSPKIAETAGTLGDGKKKTGVRDSDGKNVTYYLEKRITITARKKWMGEIPFIFHGVESQQYEPGRPPLDDLICLNADHYRTSADHKHALHWTALPTAWVAGVTDEDFEGVIGPEEAWIFEDPKTTCGMLEYEGHGLSAFEKELDRLEKAMAILGARMLEAQKKGVETASAMEIRQNGESSALSKIANSVSEQMTRALKFAYAFTTLKTETIATIKDDECSMILNTDFTASRLDSAMLTALVSAYMSNNISFDTYWMNLQRGEIAPSSVTAQEERERILASPPIMPEPEPKPEPSKEE